MSIVDRIKQYIDFKGIRVSVFERNIGMSNASFGKSYKAGGSIGTDRLENILKIYTDINHTWLLTGEGPMIRDRNDTSPTSQSEPTVIYVENPDKNDLITLQREKIRSLETELKELKRGSIGGFAASEDYNPAAEIISKMTHNKS